MAADNDRQSTRSASHSRFPLATAVLILLGLLPAALLLPPDFPSLHALSALSGWAGYGLMMTSLMLIVREVWVSRQLGGVE